MIQSNPKCVMTVNVGTQVHYIPICNRSAMSDPSVIDFSLKLAKRLEGNAKADQEQVKNIIIKLNLLKSKNSNVNEKKIMI